MFRSSPLSLVLAVAVVLTVSPTSGQVVPTGNAPTSTSGWETLDARSFSVEPVSQRRETVPSDTLRLSAEPRGENVPKEKKARLAARVDPGILLYRDPPAGTQMPTIRTPEDVDPGIVRPRDRDSTATFWLDED